MLIRALPIIARHVPNILYAIVGDGEERPELEQLARESGVSDLVQFHGEPTDGQLVQCYQQCDLFVLPNRQVGEDIEGFGMVLVEAQACGKPVVAGASGGTAETMDAPRTGRIVNCNHPEDLARVTIELLWDEPLRRTMSSDARRWAIEQFDWNSLCRQAVELFEKPEAAHCDGLQPAKVAVEQ